MYDIRSVIIDVLFFFDYNIDITPIAINAASSTYSLLVRG